MKKKFEITASRLIRPAMAFALAAAFSLNPLRADEHGDQQDHAEHSDQAENEGRKADHLGDYEKSVHKFLSQVDEMVSTYEKKGSKAVDTMKLIDDWEAAEIHPVIESTLIPVYAEIWLGINGVFSGINDDVGIEKVRDARKVLASKLWQAQGVLRMSAAVEKAALEKMWASSGKRMNGPQTIAKIKGNLDAVVEKSAAGDYKAAKEIVHYTYLHLFEGVEGTLIEQDAKLVTGLEKDFNVTLPELMTKKADKAEISDAVSAVQIKLERAGKMLAEAEKNQKDVF